MPIHFLWGDEDFLIERSINKIKKEILGDDVNEFNYKSVDNPNFSLFSELIRTNSLMFGDVVIRIKCQNYFLETKAKEKLDDKQTAELIAGLKAVSDRVHLILVCPTPKGEKKKPDSRKKLYKELIKITSPQEFPLFRSYEQDKIIPIIKTVAKEIDLKIGTNEAFLLIQIAGTSLRDLYMQIEKLKLYAYPGNVVTADMIKEVVSSSADIYALIDLMLEKNWVTSMKIINDILQKEHYLSSLAFLQTVATNLLKVKLYSNSLSSYEIAIKTNQPENIVRSNLIKVKNINLEDLVKLRIDLFSVEYSLKSGKCKDVMDAYGMAFLGDNNLC